MVLVLRHLCSQPRGQGLVQQYNVWAPFKRIAINVAGPIPQISQENRYGLFYQVAGNLSHSQPRGIDDGGSASYQLLLPLWSIARDIQRPWP
jgi:hypothetical protein